jgi:hypothetical protein
VTEELTDLAFPLRGVDVSTEFALQPPGTTPAGANCRSAEPGTDRARGGRRPGLAKYIPTQPSGANEIQHLAAVVTRSGDALTADDAVYYSLVGVPDPSDGARNFGRYVRAGGSGRQPSRNPPAGGERPPATPPPTSPGNFFVGTVTGGPTVGAYTVLFADNSSGTVRQQDAAGGEVIPTGTTVVMVRTGGAFLMQSAVWG